MSTDSDSLHPLLYPVAVVGIALSGLFLVAVVCFWIYYAWLHLTPAGWRKKRAMQAEANRPKAPPTPPTHLVQREPFNESQSAPGPRAIAQANSRSTPVNPQARPEPRPQVPRDARGASTRDAGSAGISTGNRSAPGAEFTPWISAEEKLALAAKFGWICQLCLKPIDRRISYDYEKPDPGRLVIDHIRPRRHGGSDDPANLQPVHHRCNLKKHDRWITNEEFRKWDAIRAERAESSRRLSGKGRAIGATSTTRSASAGHPHSRSQPQYTRPPSHPTVRKLRSQLLTAKLSPLMRRRAEQFLDEDHPYGLLTECQRGHEFTLENTYFAVTDGVISRQCRTCRRRSR